MLKYTLLAIFFLAFSAFGSAETPTYHKGTTKKILQLTGDFDAPNNRPTLSLTAEKAGLIATDLGSSFEHKGRLLFLFGDTKGRPGSRDAIAFSDSADPQNSPLTSQKNPTENGRGSTSPAYRKKPSKFPPTAFPSRAISI